MALILYKLKLFTIKVYTQTAHTKSYIVAQKFRLIIVMSIVGIDRNAPKHIYTYVYTFQTYFIHLTAYQVISIFTTEL